MKAALVKLLAMHVVALVAMPAPRVASQFESVATIGDTDGDKREDLIVTCSNENGRKVVVLHSASEYSAGVCLLLPFENVFVRGMAVAKSSVENRAYRVVAAMQEIRSIKDGFEFYGVKLWAYSLQGTEGKARKDWWQKAPVVVDIPCKVIKKVSPAGDIDVDGVTDIAVQGESHELIILSGRDLRVLLQCDLLDSGLVELHSVHVTSNEGKHGTPIIVMLGCRVSGDGQHVLCVVRGESGGDGVVKKWSSDLDSYRCKDKFSSRLLRGGASAERKEGVVVVGITTQARGKVIVMDDSSGEPLWAVSNDSKPGFATGLLLSSGTTRDDVHGVIVGSNGREFSSEGRLDAYSVLDGAEVWSAIGMAGDYLGWEMTQISSVDQDSIPDVVAIGKAGLLNDDLRRGTGLALFSGRDGKLLFRANADDVMALCK